jgi:hypothetical protein
MMAGITFMVSSFIIQIAGVGAHTQEGGVAEGLR